MKVVVAGGSGFLGGWLCDLLCEDSGVDAVVNYDKKRPPFPTDSRKYSYVEGVVTDKAGMEAVLDGAEEAYNMAGLLGTAELFNRMVEAVEANVLGGVQFLDAAKDMGVARICWPGKADRWPNMYTASKVAMEVFVRLYREHYGQRICVLEPWNLYGPKQTLWPVRKYFPTLAAQAILGRPLTVYGDGKHVARISHVGTAARIAIAATRSNDDAFGYGDENLHICGPAMSIKDIARDISDAGAMNAPIRYVPMRQGQSPQGLPEPPAGALDTATRLGIPSVEWETGCPAAVTWYRMTYTDAELEEALRRQDEFQAAAGQVQDR